MKIFHNHTQEPHYQKFKTKNKIPFYEKCSFTLIKKIPDKLMMFLDQLRYSTY